MIFLWTLTAIEIRQCYWVRYEKVVIGLLRPQSAKQARNYINQPSHDDSHADEYSRPFFKHNKQMGKAVSTSNDLSRLLPKRIPHEKERLYYETLQLKTSLNEIS